MSKTVTLVAFDDTGLRRIWEIGFRETFPEWKQIRRAAREWESIRHKEGQ
ncbi:MAG: hypothetical protein Q4A52_00315 [Bacillota bacterium]|nr:hypothetical protein [Bacillota bacterium]